MELKDRIAPYYLEYRGFYCVGLMDEDGLVFDKLDGRSLFVTLNDDGLVSCREFDDESVFMYEVYSDHLEDLVRDRLVNVGDLVDGMKFKLFEEETCIPEDISDEKMNQYIISILNCLDRELSSEDIVWNIRHIWRDLEECDYNRYYVERSLTNKDNDKRIGNMLDQFRLYDRRGKNLSKGLHEYFKIKLGRN